LYITPCHCLLGSDMIQRTGEGKPWVPGTVGLKQEVENWPEAWATRTSSSRVPLNPSPGRKALAVNEQPRRAWRLTEAPESCRPAPAPSPTKARSALPGGTAAATASACFWPNALAKAGRAAQRLAGGRRFGAGFKKARFRDAASFADGKNGWSIKSGFKNTQGYNIRHTI